MLPSRTLDPRLLRRTQEMLAREIFSTSARKQDTPTTTRDTYEFGYDFARMRRGDYTQTPIPAFLRELRAETRAQFKDAAALPPAQDFTNCIVSSYGPGFKLEAHADTDAATKKEKFSFGENVIGVVVKADSAGGLYFLESPDDPNPSYDAERALHLPEYDGLAFLLRGPLRHAPFYHGVNEVKDSRVSVTFRTVDFK